MRSMKNTVSRLQYAYLKIPNDHSSIQTYTAVLLHLVFIPRHNTQLPAEPSKTRGRSIKHRSFPEQITQYKKTKVIKGELHV